jgi:hypothetical protein
MMNNSKQRWATIPVVTMIASLVCGCAPDSGGEAAEVSEPQARTQKFVSAMTVTSDCGVENKPGSFNGAAGPVGTELSEMPENIAERHAVGADRDPVETDWERVAPGYVLVEPSSLAESFLLGTDKEVAATFAGDYYRSLTQILPNGNRLVSSNGQAIGFTKRGGGKSGCVEEYAANGDLLWRLNINSADYINHHDVVRLENGNILTLIWQKAATDIAISQGRDPEYVSEEGEFWFEGIVEVNPYTLDIVWEWSIRHHLIQDFDIEKSNFGIVAEHPELMNINQFLKNDDDDSVNPDWTHANALNYNPELDQIVVSVRSMNEVVVIDHSTTPRESAGHSGGRYGKGGDFLYRWGNPENYGRGTADDRKLFFQHDVQWIAPGLPGAGNLLIFNNGGPDVRPYSTIVEISPVMNPDGSYLLEEGKAYGPEELAWEYDPVPEEKFFSWYISGVQRLPNGNTFINAGAIGKQREVTSSGDIVWEYAFKNEVDAPHSMFRANKYPVDYPGLAGLIANNLGNKQ